MNSPEGIAAASFFGLLLGTFLVNTGRYRKAIELFKELLVLLKQNVGRKQELCYLTIYICIIYACHKGGDHRQAIDYAVKALVISRHQGDREAEGWLYRELASAYNSLGDYMKAKRRNDKALAISKEVGDRKGEAESYANLGTVYISLADYVKAKECFEEALAITIEIGNRKGEGVQYCNLGTVCHSLGDYMKAKEFLEKALAINIEMSDREGKGTSYGNLGNVYHSLGDYVKANEFNEKALAIKIEIGDSEGEAKSYANLGTVYKSLGDNEKAKEFQEKALAIMIEIGDRRGQAVCYCNIGIVCHSLGDYMKVIELNEKALAIRKGFGDREGKGACYANLGVAYRSLGDNVKAKTFLEKALAIRIEISDREGQGACYGNLGAVYRYVGDYEKAKECYEKACEIMIEIGDRSGEAGVCSNLGAMYQHLGDYVKAKELLEKALAIRKEIGDREGEAENYGNLGVVYHSLGFDGFVEEYYKKGLAIAIELGLVDRECNIQVDLTIWYVSKMKMKEALSCLIAAVKRFEDLRGFLRNHDKYKINFADDKSFPYNLLALMLCHKDEIAEALLVSELGRARALADLMSAQYSLQGLRAFNRLACGDIEKTMQNGTSTCTGLYISFAFEIMLFWIIKANKKVLRKIINKDALAAIPNCHESPLKDCVEFLANQCYRDLAILLERGCEDRSLFTFYEIEAECQAQAQEKGASCRLVEENEKQQEQESALRSLYKMIISPVADLLEGSEIIICPEPLLYQVPFAALMDQDERYLSEKFRIRLIPSLTTLKLIQDSPADYHSQTGVLIVGDPDVGRRDISPLPCAREEAEMIGRLLHVQPLIGGEATKEAVLQSMHSVSLIHIAAHGNAKRGEIALAPLRPMNRTPQKEDFMLTMSDVSEVQLKAKLVVLSCCHSGRGEIRTEGVIGIARAFLGSGARSVLVSLWAVDDRATKEFMREFYEHLFRGESVSECLHEAMKWMRGRPEYCAVREWAPFMLIGDNVTFNFEELTRDQWSNNT